MRIAVVGHGASSEGVCLGHVIDGSDLVLRMHDCHWQFGTDKKVAWWGTRYDVGILPGPRWWTCEKELNGRLPTGRWWCFTVYKEKPPADEYMGVPVRLTDMSWTRPILHKPGMVRGAPTRGLAAGLMALQYPNASKVLMIGCDNIKNGTMKGRPYTRAQAETNPAVAKVNENPPQGPIAVSHHFGAERALLMAEAAKAGVDVEFLP